MGWRKCLVFAAVIVSLFSGRIVAEEDLAALVESGQLDRARERAKNILSRDADHPVALYYLGRLTPDFAASRGYFERLLEGHPGHDFADDALFELAEMDYAGLALYERARRRYRELLAAYPQSTLAPRAYYRLGLTFLVMMQPDSSEAAFLKAATFSEPGLTPYIQMGLEKARGLKGAPSQANRPPVWLVQAGAFKRRQNAEKLQTRLEAAGFRVQIEQRAGSSWYFVRVGPYPDQAAAGQAKKRLRERAKIRDGMVIKRPQNP